MKLSMFLQRIYTKTRKSLNRDSVTSCLTSVSCVVLVANCYILCFLILSLSQFLTADSALSQFLTAHSNGHEEQPYRTEQSACAFSLGAVLDPFQVGFNPHIFSLSPPKTIISYLNDQASAASSVKFIILSCLLIDPPKGEILEPPLQLVVKCTRTSAQNAFMMLDNCKQPNVNTIVIHFNLFKLYE